MIVVAVVSLLGIAAAAAATASTDTRGTAAASTVKVGFIYSRTGALSGFGAEEVEGFQYGLKYLKAHAQHVRRTQARRHVRRRPERIPTTAVNAAKDLIGQGYKIIAGSTSSGVGDAGRADRGPEQRPLHLRPGGCRRGHRPEPAHVPLGPAELPGRPDGRGHPAAEERRQEGRRLRRGHRVRSEQLRRRVAGVRRQGAQRVEAPRAVRRPPT